MCWTKALRTNSTISRSLPTHPQQTKWQKHRTCLWISTLRAHDHVGFCAHLTECLQGLLRAQQPCPMPLPSLVRPGQAQTETLRPFKKKCETPSGELWIFFSCNKCPLGVLACILLHSCSQPFPKVWETLAGSQRDDGAFLDLGVCRCLTYWQEEERPEQLGDCCFSLFPNKCLNSQHHIINSWLSDLKCFLMHTFVPLLQVSYFNSNSPIYLWILTSLTPTDINLSPGCEDRSQ